MNLFLDKIYERVIKKINSGQFVRMIFLGSSNTQRRIPGMHWGDWLEMLCKRKCSQSFRENLFQAFNVGIGGEKSQETILRIQRDVIDLSPDAVILTIGGNDAFQGVSAEKYRSNLMRLYEMISGAGILLIFQTYYGCDLENIESEIAERLNAFMQIIRETAKVTESPLIDHYSRWTPIMLQREYVDKLLLDPMHTTELGNLVIGLDLAEIFGCEDVIAKDFSCIAEEYTPQDLRDMMMKEYSKEARQIRLILDSLSD